MTTFDPNKIEQKLDASEAGSMPVSMELGGVRFERMIELMDFAKIMSLAHTAVPPYLRNNPGDCQAILLRAIRWKMDPYAVAEQSYQVSNKGVTSIAYMAQLIHAVVTRHAPLKGRLRHEILGEGDERRCRVWGTFKGEEKEHSYTSPTLKEMREARGKNDAGNIKGSPLWATNPEVQLAYSTVRQWARLYASEVLFGVYAVDEAEQMIDVTPPKPATVGERLRAHRDKKPDEPKGRGFDAGHVERETAAAGKPSPATVQPDHVMDGDAFPPAGATGQPADAGATNPPPGQDKRASEAPPGPTAAENT